jgi:YggT family protein
MNTTGATQFLIQTLFDLYAYIVLARVLLQAVRADFYNPISQFVVKATDPLLKPLHRVLPLRPIDIGGVLVFFLVVLIKLGLLIFMVSKLSPTVSTWVVSTLFNCFGLLISFYVYAIFMLVIFSWIQPGSYSPISLLLHQITEPLIAPVRRIIPAAGGIDWAPMVVMLLLYLIKILFNLP